VLPPPMSSPPMGPTVDFSKVKTQWVPPLATMPLQPGGLDPSKLISNSGQ
jgi:hypothetical protein